MVCLKSQEPEAILAQEALRLEKMKVQEEIPFGMHQIHLAVEQMDMLFNAQGLSGKVETKNAAS